MERLLRAYSIDRLQNVFENNVDNTLVLFAILHELIHRKTRNSIELADAIIEELLSIVINFMDREREKKLKDPTSSDVYGAELEHREIIAKMKENISSKNRAIGELECDLSALEECGAQIGDYVIIRYLDNNKVVEFELVGKETEQPTEQGPNRDLHKLTLNKVVGFRASIDRDGIIRSFRIEEISSTQRKCRMIWETLEKDSLGDRGHLPF